ncbi:MAG: efflux RND transporter periplasmic adaptor subunit [Deltaproteobacteria bacterium]|nr:efflux RND transporter periplasmic adaptor subunit [Deltaproteobacteria bacterium]
MTQLSKGWRGALLILALLLVGLVLYRGWGLAQKRAEPQKTKQAEIPVQVSLVAIRPITYAITMTGDIAPLMQVALFPKVSGYLEGVYVNAGDSVREGQTIAQIDRSDYLQKVREVEARVAQARAHLMELEAGARTEELRQTEEAVRSAESRFENAKLQRERMEALYQRQVISKRELDVADMEYTVAQAQLASSREHLKLLREGARQEVRESAQARLKETEAMLAQERIRLQHTKIVAPFSGEISRRYMDAGALASSSTPIVNLIHTETLKVVAHILEKDIPLLKTGMKARIMAESFPGKVFEGRIARISSALEPATRTLHAEIEIPNAGRMLKPSMFATIELVLSQKPQAVVIPQHAVIEERGSKIVYVIQGNQAFRRTIVTGIEQTPYVEVLQGVSEGDQVVVRGQDALREGSVVRMIEGG